MSNGSTDGDIPLRVVFARAIIQKTRAKGYSKPDSRLDIRTIHRRDVGELYLQGELRDDKTNTIVTISVVLLLFDESYPKYFRVV